MSDTILIVDDSLTIRMDLAEAFESAGFEIGLCTNLEEGREVLARRSVDAIVLDVVLPDGCGIEFLQELRSNGVTSPVIMLSSEAEVRNRIIGLQAGADEYVGKPYDRDYVVARASELIRASRVGADEAPILLIDDSVTVRREVGALLENEGYRVLTAATGEEGLRLVSLHRPSLVIVDSILPGIDGATVIRRLRMDSVLCGTPCLMLTGSGDSTSESRMLDAGADAFLKKNEVPALLLARVAAVIRAGQAPPDAPSSLLGPARLLAVDDSSIYLQALVDALGGEGFDIVLARSGEEALEMLAVQPVDCILMELLMPGLGGLEACRRIKSVRGIGDIPLILLASKSDEDTMLEGLAAGADDFVSKSAEFDVLRARVRAQLRRKQFQDEKRRVQAELMERELEATEARAALELAQTRADLLGELEAKHGELEQAYQELKSTQIQLVQSAKMASLGQLVAGIAHEINNPLTYAVTNVCNVIEWVGQLDSTVKPNLSDKELRRWEKIHIRLGSTREGIDRVKELVRKLRTFSRLDEGEFKTVEVPDCIDSVLAFLEHRMKGRISVEQHYAGVTRLDCFPSSLNQVLMNLVANAIEAIEGAGTITISTENDENWYRIRVRDSGPGLPPGLEDKLFEPFFTTKPIGEGTGLGLSISFGIMQAHRGHIHAKNHPDGGCEFLLEIPLDLEAMLGES
ncbi:MAG: response regulator [Vulcanimicrobiota bacterium]